MTPDIPALVAEGTRLTEAATPGPWWVERGGDGHADPDEFFYAVNPGSRWRGLTNPLNCDSDESTARLIAWWGTNGPTVLAELGRLHDIEAERDAQKERADHAEKMNADVWSKVLINNDRVEAAEAERDRLRAELDAIRDAALRSGSRQTLETKAARAALTEGADQ